MDVANEIASVMKDDVSILVDGAFDGAEISSRL
jgi:hypothetical protein